MSASLSGQLTNHGFVIAFSGSYEKDQKTYFVKRFGSNNASNVFDRPQIVIKYDDTTVHRCIFVGYNTQECTISFL